MAVYSLVVGFGHIPSQKVTASLNMKNRLFPLIPFAMISFVLSESMGSGHGSGSRLPVVTTVTFTFAFFVLGPSDMLMGIATSLETLVGVGL